VNATLELIDQLSAKMSIPLITQGIYVWVYSHLLENQAEFTIKSFTQRFIQFIARSSGSNTIELTIEIRRHAKKIMVKRKEFGVVFKILEEIINSDEVHKTNELQSTQSKDHKLTDDTAALLVPHSNLESTEARIGVLLHYWAYLELPRWLSQERPEVADVPALKNLVIKHHLAHFVKKMKASGYESRIITGLIKDIPLSAFFRIISVRFYHVSGYVNSVLKLTRLLSSKISVPLITNGLYIWVYSYLLKSEGEFTAQSFTLRFIQFISVNNRLNNKELTKKLLDLASKTEEGVSQFEVILEILRSLVDVKELHKIKENAITASQEVGQKAQLDNFIDALGSYIRFGTMPLGMYNTIFSKEEFLQAFDNLTERDTRQVEEHIRGLLSNRMLLENFVKRAEDQVLRRIVKIFSAGRFAEFESWMKEMKEFISLSMEYEDATLARFIPSMTLLSLLLGRNSTLISLIQFIEHALSSLSSQVTNQFMLGEKIVAYKTRSEASTYFVKTLETVEASIKEKGRQTILQKLLTEKPDTKKEVPVSISGKLRVQNAGIVLVAPFLYRYFEKLEMTQEGMFKTDELSWRAVQLVQFLASGSTEAYEHDLILNKILCGVDIDIPIERKIELTSLELEVSESLLSGVLQNWDKIKTESLDALREGFLMREGYLEDAEMSWTLEVDRKAMDVLVDLIPWSFSTTKLSWMKKSLTTIWQSDEYRNLM
ncbi:MAG: contractile injection system tape measure protein, partial [Bacteroidota bacterium]